ncbi:hypothetical protein HanIR_Chr08g0359391 [Helianthus annuus]|nr:hypothetical protein HanIR_Chr08g0359391 [Helianthus annuus]
MGTVVHTSPTTRSQQSTLFGQQKFVMCRGMTMHPLGMAVEEKDNVQKLRDLMTLTPSDARVWTLCMAVYHPRHNCAYNKIGQVVAPEVQKGQQVVGRMDEARPCPPMHDRVYLHLAIL